MAADFQKDIHEESSLTLRERVEEFFEKVSLKWQEFIDWSDEKGLPLRKANDFFESKGIPALPALVILLLLFSGAAYLAFLSVSSPVSKTFTINVRDTNNNALEGASVQLQFSDASGNLQTKTLQSDSGGKAVFENIPASKATVAVTAVDFESDTKQAIVTEGQDNKLVTFTLASTGNPNVVIAVTVAGPVAADISLLAGNGSILQEQNATTIAQFQVSPNQNYSIVAKAVQYRDELKTVQVGNSNLNIPLRMFKEGEERTAPIYARVYLQDGSTPVANATVKVLDESTGAVIATGETGEDGAAPAMDVAVGRNVSISASKEGYLTYFLPTLTVNEPEASVVAKLVEKTEENSKNIVITVIDDNGKAIETPHIALYCEGAAVDVKEPRNGIAGFDVAIGKTCTAGVSKDGFIPVQKQITSATQENMIMHAASSSNSGTIVVETRDKDSSTVAGVDVALFIDGKPTGIVKQSGIDGVAKFEFLPLTTVSFIGSSQGKEGTATAEVKSVNETGIEGENVVLLLAPAKAVINVDVRDHFTRNPIANAVATFTTSNGTSATCTTVAGTCSTGIESGKTTAVISAPGFETLSTEFDALPGNNTESFELISHELSSDTELVFVGVFNEENQRVSLLNPASRYTAKYLLKAVSSIDFTSATAFVQIGEPDVGLENGAGVITSFSSSGGRMVGGVDYSSADSFQAGGSGNNGVGGAGAGSLKLVQEDFHSVAPATQVLANGDLTPLPSTSGTSASLSSQRVKWVEFTFDKFTGTKELKVGFQTNAVENANVELFHRTAYEASLANGSTETFRSPEDKDAGVTKSPLLAKLSEPNVLPIHFEGKCSENACLELWFEGASGKASAFSASSFEATVPETFKLNYRLLSPPLQSQASPSLSSSNAAFTLTLQTDSDALQFVSGNSSANGATAASSTISRQVKPGDPDGFFALKALKASSDAPISFTMTGPSSFEQPLHVAVSNAGNQLKINVLPQQVNAFEQSTITFRVTDNFGTIVPGARVVLQKGSILASEVQGREDAPGTYTADISPNSFGQLAYSIQAEGFKAKKGVIPVIAKKLVSIEPTTGLSVSPDSLEQTEGSTFTLTNLVPDKQVKVTLRVSPSGSSPKYSTTYVSDQTFNLKGGESRTVTLLGRILDNVIPFSAQANTLKENYSGQVSLTASVVGFTQTSQLAFTTNAFFQVQPLSQLIGYSADSLDFAVDLPVKPIGYKSIKVTNNAAKAVLINQQSNLPGVRVTPVSMVIAPGQTATFNVTGGPSPFALADQCIFEDLSEKGAVEFIASFQGVATSKVIPVNVATTSHGRCIVPNGVGVRLPMDINLVFPFGTVTSKTNPFDASQPVKLPNGELMVFSQGAQVTHQRAYIPAGVQIEISAGYVQQLSGDEFQVRFPIPAVISSPPNANEVTQQDGSLKLSTLAADIILPPGSQQAFQGGNTFSPQFNPQFGFNNNLDYQRFGSFFGAGNSHMLQPLQPMRIIATHSLEGEPFEITYDEDVYVDFTADSQVQQSGSTVTASLSTCTQLKVYVKMPDNTKEVKEVLPSTRSVTLTQATLNGRTALVSKGGKISLKMCLGQDEETRYFQTKLRAPVTFVLPPGTPDPRSTALRVNYPNCAELVYRSGYSLGVSSVKKIIFPQTANVKPALDNGAIEVEVPAEETVSFAPCRSTTPSVSTFAGLGIEAYTKENKPLVFTFSELDIGKTRTADATICLVNKRHGIVSAVGNSFIASATGNVNDMDVKLEPVKPNVVQQLSPSPKGECNNEFKLTGKIPQSTTDGVCVVRPNEEGFQETITFRASDSTGWSGTVDLPVKIIVKHDEKACKRDNEKAASELLSGFFVDYASDSKNDRSGTGFVFTFKGTGNGHQRVLTLLNNYESALSLQVTPAASLTCAFPYPPVIQAGQAIAIRCTPQHATVGVDALKITATGGTRVFEKTVAVQVYDGDKNVYKNSPWGELAPLAEKRNAEKTTATQSASQVVSFATGATSVAPVPPMQPSESVSFATTANDASVGQTRVIGQNPEDEGTGFISQCSRHYCTYEQAQKAYDDFLSQLAGIADQKLQSDAARQRFCEAGANAGNYIKSTVIHLVNTNQDLATQIASSGTVGGLQYSVASGIGSLKGCGVYVISAKLDLCSQTSLGASPSENKARSKIQIIDAQKLAECPNNVANAPLFLASKQDDLNIFIGNQLGAGMQKPAYLKFGGIFALGPYENRENKGDVATVKSLMHSVYGSDGFKVTATKPQRYENDQAWKFCLKNAGIQAGTILGASAAVSATGSALGFGAPFMFKIVRTLGDTAIGLGLSALGEGTAAFIPGGNEASACSYLNGAIRSALFGAVSGPFSSQAAGAAGLRGILPSKGGAVAYSLVTIGATAGSEIYNNVNGGSPDIPPGAAGPTAYAGARTIGSQISPALSSFDELYGAISGQEKFQGLIPSTPDGKEALEEILKLDAKNPGRGVYDLAEVSEFEAALKRGENPRGALLRPNQAGALDELDLFERELRSNPSPQARAAFEADRAALRQQVLGEVRQNRLALQQEINAFTKDVRAVKASAVVEALSQKFGDAADPQFLEEVYEKARSTKGDDKAIADAVKKLVKAESDAGGLTTSAAQPSATAGAPSTAAEAASHGGTAAGTSGAAGSGAEAAATARALNGQELTEIETATAAALKSATPEKISRFAKFKAGAEKFGKGAAAVGVQLAVQFLLDVDVRPTEFRVPASTKNALFVYHIENPLFAPRLSSAHRVCIQDSHSQCVQKFYLGDSCNSDTDACLLSYHLPGRGEDSYSLFVVMNNQQVAGDAWFDSITYPQAPTLALPGAFKVGEISTAEISRLSKVQEDTGSEKALKSSAADEPSSDSQVVITGDDTSG